jgi:hypothetical protein
MARTGQPGETNLFGWLAVSSLTPEGLGPTLGA